MELRGVVFFVPFFVLVKSGREHTSARPSEGFSGLWTTERSGRIFQSGSEQSARPTEAAAPPGVVGKDVGAEERQDFRDGLARIESLMNGAFERADAMLDVTLVRRLPDGTVERHDAFSGEETVKDRCIERREQSCWSQSRLCRAEGEEFSSARFSRGGA